MFIVTFLGAIVLWAIMRAVWALLAGLFFMLAVGVAHHEWLPQLPTLGYWWATLIALLAGAALGVPTVSSSSRD
jgi:hypothetical protein